MENSTKSNKSKIQKSIKELDKIFTEYGSKEKLELLEKGLKNILFLFISINQKSNLEDTNLIIDYITKLCSQCNDSNEEKLPVLVGYIGFFIHSIKVSSKNISFISTSSSSNFYNNIFRIILILRN